MSPQIAPRCRVCRKAPACPDDQEGRCLACAHKARLLARGAAVPKTQTRLGGL